jgi:hypothetical protein
MADNHGNTPAAWTAVAVALLGFVVGGVALMLSPVSMTLFWVGVALGLVAFPLFLLLSRLGFNSEHH